MMKKEESNDLVGYLIVDDWVGVDIFVIFERENWIAAKKGEN